ncbi:MAG: toll/interleukin-1 receptor domain-containing protein [Actinobacteria bacterium]|nr:toll/interleukin-1 receptor domain-containing protein [Actinomycetota bacterium]
MDTRQEPLALYAGLAGRVPMSPAVSVVSVNAKTRLAVMEQLAQRSDGQIRQFFLAHGYDAAYAQPKLASSSKASRIAAAVGAADRDGRRDELLEQAIEHFGFSAVDDAPAEGGAIERSPLPAQPVGAQARQVRAWYNLFDARPTIQVVNNSDAPIRDVVPTLTLVSQSSGTMLGGSPFWNSALAELPPFRAFAWSMDHMRAAASDTSVQSHLLVDFTDAAGRRWQIGYDQLVAIEPLAEDRLRYVDLAQPPVNVDEVDLPLDVEAEASAESVKVAFISYVHEDAADVDRLQGFLQANGVTVWRDRNNLIPGDNWKQVIRETITRGSFAFIACFSQNSVSKAKTYMNEALGLAVEELRRRNTTNWFVPVLLSDCDPPDIEIGLHGRLSDIHQCRIFEDWPTASRQLLASIRRLS